MDKRGVGLVFLTAIISGFAIFINKFGVGGINSSIFTFSKNVVVAVFVLSLIFLFKEFREIKSLTKKQLGKLVLIGLFGGSIPFLLFFRGLQLANAATAAFIHKMMFIFVVVMAVVFLKEKIKKGLVIGAIMLLLGNGLLLGFVWKGFGIGELMILVATLFWAVEQIVSKHTLKELSSKVVMLGRMFFGCFFILVYLLFAGKLSLIASLSSNQIGWIIISSGFLFFYVLTWYRGLKLIDVSVATCILLLGSVITTLLYFVFLGKELALNQVIGMLLLVAGVVIAVGYTHLIDLIKHLNQWSKKHGWG